MALLQGFGRSGRSNDGPTIDLSEVRGALLAGGTAAGDVLDILVDRAASLLDAPARIAEPVDGRLVWTRSHGVEVEAGSLVPTEGTLCGAAWRSGMVQFDSTGVSTRCCGSPASALAVPIVHLGAGAGRHTEPGHSVDALLVLTADRPDWFDGSDVQAALGMAAAASARIAVLQDGAPLAVARQPLTPPPVPAPAPPATPASFLAPAIRPAPPSRPSTRDGVDAGTGTQGRSRRPSGNAFDGWFNLVQPEAPSSRHPEPVVRPRGIRATPSLPSAMPAPETLGLWQWDATTGTCNWSAPVARLLGVATDVDLTLAGLRQVVHPSDRERFDVALTAVRSGRGVAGGIRVRTDADTSVRHAYAWSEVRRSDRGELLGAWGGVVDVTAFENDSAQLRQGLAAQRAAQELAGLATWQWHPATQELVWSDEMYRLLGVDPDECEPTLAAWHAFVHPDDLHRATLLDLHADLEPGAERVETFRLVGAGGMVRNVQSWSAVSTDEEPSIYGATIDVTRQVQDRVMLEQQSATDPVTGLGNRLAYDRRITELLEDRSRLVTLMLLDLDRFKVVNDSLGHQVGDRLLIEVARRLGALVPDGSLTARMGGDEFVVVPPPGTPELDVRRLAVGIVDALRAPYVLPETGELLVCPASVGIALSGQRRVTPHDLLREADIALVTAKDGGRDRFTIFDAELRAAHVVRLRAERRLREGLQADRLTMEFQPVVDFATGRVVGAEGLVRMREGEDGDDRMVPPEVFIDVAEQTGLVVEVDCWVIESAIAQIAAWGESTGEGMNDQRESPWVAINLSARSMEHPRVVRRLVDAVRQGEIAPERLKIELTEKSFIGALPGVEAGLRRLIANGIRIGVDDFGTGYSALAFLQHYDLDFMKIDRSFMAGVGENDRADAVVKAITDLAHAHGMTVIAEGVETARHARRLRELGCDFAQGWHFGRPGAAELIVRG